MKRIGKWLLGLITSALTLVLVIVLLPYAAKWVARIMPDESAAAIRASVVLSQKLEQSAKLETLHVTEEGALNYGGGGKKMIAQYEADTRTPDLDAPRPYGLTQSHKHLPEMQQISCLTHAPIFAPIVADYYAGMQVTIPLFRQQLNCAHPVEELTACLKAHYASSPIVSVLDAQDVAAFGGFIPANALAGKDSMKLMVLGNDDRIELVSLFDNLGKGSSGAAIECLNLMTGAPETTGLNL